MHDERAQFVDIMFKVIIDIQNKILVPIVEPNYSKAHYSGIHFRTNSIA